MSEPVEQPSPRPRRRGIYVLPNLFTTAALFGGFYAIVMAMNERYDQAAIAIFIAMVLDGLDGRIARMTNTQSKFGAEFDSLSDMVSFGVAPALVMFSFALGDLGKFGWSAAFVYVACAALRPGVVLAKVARCSHSLGHSSNSRVSCSTGLDGDRAT